MSLCWKGFDPGGSLSWWVTTARTSVHFPLPTACVTFAAISSCRNIAFIPILSVDARFGSLWSLNNFAGLRFPPHCICISLLLCLLSSQLGYLPGCNLFIMAYPYCLLGATHILPEGYHPQMSCNQDNNREIREISLRLYLRIILWHYSSGFTTRISLIVQNIEKMLHKNTQTVKIPVLHRSIPPLQISQESSRLTESQQ